MTNETKLTAVDLMFERAISVLPMGSIDAKATLKETYQHAKEMEKERIETAYNKGTVHGIDYPESTLPLTGEQYYNEAYGGNK